MAFEVYEVTLKKVMTEMTSKNGFSGNKGRHELMLVAGWRKGGQRLGGNDLGKGM